MFRRLAPLAVLLSPALLPVACGTGVVGVDECREIEEARCDASATCGAIEDVDACKRFVRDHCMHGLPGSAPTDEEQSDCVGAIQAAAACAENGKKGPETAPAQCPGGAPAKRRTGKPLTTTCAIVERPWDTDACSFLSASADSDGEGGAGGASGK